MTELTAMCPYCRSAVAESITRCTSCDAVFPWAREIEILKEQLKERETNRVRATTTLVEELFAASRGQGAVSVAAIKGFVTSWLFPRTVIVLGSIAGAVLLAIQTYILWNQTKLLSIQTQASQLEQAAKLRERISGTYASASRVRRLISAYSISVPPTSCAADCKGSLALQALKGVGGDPPVAPPPFAATALLEFAAGLGTLSHAGKELVASPAIDLEKKSDDLAVVSDLIVPAATQCLYDPDRARSLVDAANTFALLAENAVWVQMPMNGLEKYLEFSHKYPQVASNTKMGLLQLENAVRRTANLTSSFRRAASVSDRDLDSTYALGALITDAAFVRDAVLVGLKDLASRCDALAKQDAESLKAMETSLR